MSYDSAERGHGRPVDLYEFARAHLRWRYTSADRDISIGGVDYVAEPIERSAIEASREINRATLSIIMPRANPVADLYRIAPPSDVVTCIIRQTHIGDGEVVTLWTGRIIGVEWSGARAKLALEPVYTSVRRMGLRRRYQRACPHVLYGLGCNLSRETWRLDTTASSIAGLTVTAPGVGPMGDGYYAGGYIEWDTPAGVAERRHISAHVGPNLTLTAAPYGLVIGQSIRVYPGCDHTLATCHGKFGNAANYGGMPYIPQKNPFGSLNPIY